MPVDPRISEWGNPSGAIPTSVNTEANAGNRNIPVPAGRESRHDSPSRGDRTGKSPNRRRREACAGVIGPSVKSGDMIAEPSGTSGRSG